MNAYLLKKKSVNIYNYMVNHFNDNLQKKHGLFFLSHFIIKYLRDNNTPPQGSWAMFINCHYARIALIGTIKKHCTPYPSLHVVPCLSNHVQNII